MLRSRKIVLKAIASPVATTKRLASSGDARRSATKKRRTCLATRSLAIAATAAAAAGGIQLDARMSRLASATSSRLGLSKVPMLCGNPHEAGVSRRNDPCNRWAKSTGGPLPAAVAAASAQTPAAYAAAGEVVDLEETEAARVS